MAGLKTALYVALGTTAALALLGACDNGPSAVAPQAADNQMAATSAAFSSLS